MRKALAVSLIVLVMITLSMTQPRAQGQGQVLLPIAIPGLQQGVLVLSDSFEIPHIYAQNAHDLYLVTGYLQARDRLFQMDVTRREASGTLAELLGPAALSSDVQTRTLGLRRAAELSAHVMSAGTQADLQAYADGVNAYIEQAERNGSLPPEYGALRLSQVASWTAIDSLTVGKAIAFQLSFDLQDVGNTLAFIGYLQALAGLGLDGAALFSDDLFRSAPSEPAAVIPDAQGKSLALGSNFQPDLLHDLNPTTLPLLRGYYQAIKANPFFRPLLRGSATEGGSNWWIVSGKNSVSGFPLMASDPHLALSNPSVWYEIDQKINDGKDLDVIGTTFPGVPYVILGHNARISWSATVNPLDVTDFYSEKIRADANGELFSIFAGKPEPVQVIPEQYKVNLISAGKLDNVVPAPPNPQIPPVTLIIPRHGPIVNLDLKAGSAVSVQYTGFYATREVETFRSWDQAQNLDDFKAGLATFEVGSQNWGYADVDGNIAYFTSAKSPLRQDLQQGFVDHLPPFMVRDGTGTLQHQWIQLANPPTNGTIPFATLPPGEMPQTVNPATGVIASSNNDPIGITFNNNPLSKKRADGGILYLDRSYDPGYRAQRVTDLIHQELQSGQKISLQDMERIQSDVTELIAQQLTPFVIGAISNAGAPSAPDTLAQFTKDSRIAEVGARLSKWDFSTPTGLTEGFDAGKPAGAAPNQQQIDNSVATTLFNVWLGRFIHNTIDATLNAISPQLPKPDNDEAVRAVVHLLLTFDKNQGVGSSGVDFFAVPGLESAPAPVRRDVVILKSLSDALDLLSGDAFASAFKHSKNLADYRWGLLHTITFEHILGGPFNIPPSGGFSTDGGYQVIDRSDFNVRAASADGYSFNSGPSRRYVAELRPDGIQAFEVIPGGESGVPGSAHYGDQVPLWLANGYHPLFFSRLEVYNNVGTWQDFVPPGGSAP